MGPSLAARAVGHTATQEKAATRIASRLSEILGGYVDPYAMVIIPAIGAWSHGHKDVQRFTGTIRRFDLPNLTYTFGSWDMTVSQIASGHRFEIVDCRDAYRRASDFEINRNMRAKA